MLHSESTGKLYVDQGAEEAILYNGKSLLPAGVVKVKGNFYKGDVVEVFGLNGILGKGEVSYSSEELRNTIENQKQGKNYRNYFHRPLKSFIVTKLGTTLTLLSSSLLHL